MEFKDKIKKDVKHYPVTFISGARGVGKTTLVKTLAKELNFNYVSLENIKDCLEAKNDRVLFLENHKWPLIIDDIEKAPELFEAIYPIVNKEAFLNDNNNSMYILVSNIRFEVLDIKESMAGRISINEMNTLSNTKINTKINTINLEKQIIKGFYPMNNYHKIKNFYENYLNDFINKEVKAYVKEANLFKFYNFLHVIAELTTEELNLSYIAKKVKVDGKTITQWLKLLYGSDLVDVVLPYYEYGETKRVVRRVKMYFKDTGLLCYLLGVKNLKNIYQEKIYKTYVIAEINKQLKNDDKNYSLYYYRDSNHNQIDLIIHMNGGLYCFNININQEKLPSSIKMLKKIKFTMYQITNRFIVVRNLDSDINDEEIKIIHIVNL